MDPNLFSSFKDVYQKKDDFIKHLDDLSKPKVGRFLIIDKKKVIKETHVVKYIWENIKSLFTGRNQSASTLVRMNTINFIEYGVLQGWIQKENIETVKNLAKRAFGAKQAEGEKREINGFINQITQETLNKKPHDLDSYKKTLSSYYVKYKDDISKYPSEEKKILKIFQEIGKQEAEKRTRLSLTESSRLDKAQEIENPKNEVPAKQEDVMAREGRLPLMGEDGDIFVTSDEEDFSVSSEESNDDFVSLDEKDISEQPLMDEDGDIFLSFDEEDFSVSSEESNDDDFVLSDFSEQPLMDEDGDIFLPFDEEEFMQPYIDAIAKPRGPVINSLDPPKGIPNPLNNCFCNSVYQAILSTEYLKQKALASDLPEIKNCFETLLSSNSSKSEINRATEALIRKAADIGAAPQLVAGKQADAMEYLQIILNQINVQNRMIETRSSEKISDVSQSKDNSPALLLRTKDPIHIQDLISSFQKEEHNDPNNPWHGVASYTKETHLGAFEPTIILNMQGIWPVVSYPEDEIVDLSVLSKNANEPQNYRVASFIEHFGSVNELTGEALYGHYVSFVKKGDQWYRCNDETVRPISNADAKANLSRAYIVVLEKVN